MSSKKQTWCVFIFNELGIGTGKIVARGFYSEEEAEQWMEENMPDAIPDYDYRIQKER